MERTKTFNEGQKVEGVWESDGEYHEGVVYRHGGWDGEKELVHVEWNDGSCSQEPVVTLTAI